LNRYPAVFYVVAFIILVIVVVGKGLMLAWQWVAG
jgi:hypothetical protein